jgi:hypothetical protein
MSAATTTSGRTSTPAPRKPRTAKAKVTTTKPAPAKVEPKTPTVPTNCGCGCGCGQPNVRGKASYLSGHDARHAGQVGRAIIADPAKAADLLKALPTEALQRKALGMVKTAEAKQAKVNAAKAAKAAAKAAYDKALAEALKA